jgi:hypothetical protein
VRLGATFKRFFGQMGAVADLARSDMVTSLVPADAQYVTVGPIAVLPSVRLFRGGEAGGSRYGRDLGYLPAGARQEICLLVLTPDRLTVLERSGVRWSSDIAAVTDLDGHRRGGFLVYTSRSDGLAVGQQTPIEVPPGARFRTVAGMTNVFCGWDEVLAPFGVKRHF